MQLLVEARLVELDGDARQAQRQRRDAERGQRGQRQRGHGQRARGDGLALVGVGRQPGDVFLDRAVEQRDALRQIPEGTYHYVDYLDNDGIEFGRKVLYSNERPSFTELEEHVKKAKR